jgi:hypothetical protein
MWMQCPEISPRVDAWARMVVERGGEKGLGGRRSQQGELGRFSSDVVCGITGVLLETQMN